jgi:type III restriction enzyme
VGNPFFEAPILNSPYECPSQHWELDDQGQPTQRIIETRRDTRYVSPIPQARRQTGPLPQSRLTFGEGDGFTSGGQAFDPTPVIREVRSLVAAWRTLPNPNDWLVTPETARLLQHWRHHPFTGVRPFFCQIEAAEVAIWLTEVAPSLSKRPNVKRILDHLKNSNAKANPGLSRLALKLATGAGKTTVMAMLIAWQTLNAIRRPDSTRFTRGFLLVTPGLTIKDRLRVLEPNHPESYYKNRELVPADLAGEIQKAKIVITNYHAFKPRERMEISRVGRALLQGRGKPIKTLETEGQMIQRVMGRTDGPEEHHGPERRGAPLLPRKGAVRRRTGVAQGRRKRGSKKEQRSRPPLDFRPRSRGTSARHHTGYGSFGYAVLPARFGLSGKYAVWLDNERFFTHGRHRMRHCEIAARAGRG